METAFDFNLVLMVAERCCTPVKHV